MNVNEWTGPFLQFAARLNADRGHTVVALVLRGEVAAVASTSASGITQRWDLWIAGDWISVDREKDLQYVVGLFRQVVGAAELMRVSRILLRRGDDPMILSLTAHAKPAFGITRITYPELLPGMAGIREAIIFVPPIPAGVAEKPRGKK